jgi:cytochrome c oxidase subunit 5a
MSSSVVLRSLVRGSSKTFFRAYRPVTPNRAGAFVPGVIAGSSLNFSTTVARRSDAHHEETFEEFCSRSVTFIPWTNP